MDGAVVKLCPSPYTAPLSDVPALLRQIADEIERDEEGAKACIVIIDWVGSHQDYGCDVRLTGRDGDPLRSLGLLTVATDDLVSAINGGEITRVVKRREPD